MKYALNIKVMNIRLPSLGRCGASPKRNIFFLFTSKIPTFYIILLHKYLMQKLTSKSISLRNLQSQTNPAILSRSQIFKNRIVNLFITLTTLITFITIITLASLVYINQDYSPNKLYASRWKSRLLADNLCSPTGILVYLNTIYFVDTCSNSIKTITTQGPSIYTGGQGYVDGDLSLAKFNEPFGIAVDSKGSFYVTDAGNNCIRKIQNGILTTFAGGQGGVVDGTGGQAKFAYPTGIAIDNDDNVYICDTYNHLIRKVSKEGVVSTFAGVGSPGSSSGIGQSAYFNAPVGITFNPADNCLYVTDTTTSMIRKVTIPDAVVTDFAGNTFLANANYPGTPSVFNSPQGITVGLGGNIYVADSYYSMIRVIYPDGVVDVISGAGDTGYQEGIGPDALFMFPRGICMNGSEILVADTFSDRIRILSEA